MIDKKTLIEIANKFTFTDKTQERQYKDFLKYCVDNAPKVGEWIPVSERLPKTDGRFEVTIKGCKGKRHVEMCNFYKNAKTTPWGLGKWEHGNVIAWRQRSEPYRKDVE